MEYERIGKRWTKGDMDRVYINIDREKEYDGIRIRNYFNRYEWDNLKVYYDIVKGTLVISKGNEEAKQAVTHIVNEMLSEK